MLAWSEGTDNGRQKTRNHGYDVIVGGNCLLITPITLANLSTLNPKLKSTGAGRYQLLSRWWDAHRKRKRPERLLSEKSGRCWHCNRLRSVALYLWLIVVISVRQSTVATISGLHCQALVIVSSSIRLTADCKIQRSGRVREIDVWAESPRLSPLWLSASSSACHGLLIITDNAITYKAQRDKNARELKLANAAITDMQMRQRDVAALDAKYTKG